jgi:hypothetical protein
VDLELESNRAAFEFGKSVQRVADRQAADVARSRRFLAYLLCALSGFFVGLLVAGIMTFVHQGLKVW